MADVTLVWDQERGRADWQVVHGRIAAGRDLETAILLALFTDRKAKPGFVPPDRTGDLRGWWGDSLSGQPIGSLLWTLERRKIVNRATLAAEAIAIVNEALAPLPRQGVCRSINAACSVPPAGPGQPGTLLVIEIAVVESFGTDRGFRYAYRLN